MKHPLKRTFAYLWAAPTTSVGLVAVGLTCLSGGKLQVREGAVECHGGFARWFLSRRAVSASAMTLGHVILGRSTDELDRCRAHEQVHVRQVERWGGLFLPAYIMASVSAWKVGRHYYYDNHFEIDARRKCSEPEDLA